MIETQANPVATRAGTPRFLALDVFRGATIFLMILVNAPGSGAEPYPQLLHAAWFGFTLADLVFPSFLFAMGTAMYFAFRKPVATAPFLARLLRRGAIIFVLGYLLYWFPFIEQGANGWELKPFAQTRVPGVLQRLALCYVLAALLIRWLRPRQLLLAAIALLLGYWAILLGFSPPGMGYDRIANIGTQIDLWLLGPGHLYKQDGSFDPEGLLGTLPATVNVIAGYLAGVAIVQGGDLRRTVDRMALVGGALVLAGLVWSPWFPIAKKLWTSSYVLLTVGIDLLLLGATIWLIQVAGLQRGTRFFAIVGRNPLAIYLLSELLVMVLGMIPAGDPGGVYDAAGIRVFQAIAPGPLGSLSCAFAYTMLCWAMGWWMDRKGLILKA